MAKSLQRKKPGYTKGGEVKIVSLSVKQLAELLDRTQKNKIKAKINRRISDLKSRKGFVEVVEVSSEEVVESVDTVA